MVMLTLSLKSSANQKSPSWNIQRHGPRGGDRLAVVLIERLNQSSRGILCALFPRFQFGNGQRCKETGIGVYDASEATEYATGFSQDVVENFHAEPLMCYADSGMAKGIGSRMTATTVFGAL